MNQYDQWNRRIRTIWYCSSLYVEYKNALRKSKKMPVEKKNEYWEKKHEEFATKMLNNIYELRGWWVKVGQFLSTQENIMPVAYIEKFTKLQDMMPTSPFEKIEVILKRELGSMYELFEYIDKTPLASASIGQVHKARLKKGMIIDNMNKSYKNDYNVIIKIQHEGIDKFLSSDISTLKKVSWAFGLIDKNFNFGDYIEEWQNSASRELNYNYELYHQLLAYNTCKNSSIDLKIPKIYCAYTTSKVLVMEYIKGFKITDTKYIKKYNINTYDLIYKIIDYFAYQIHSDGFFHGDPHPGNILVMLKRDCNKDKRARSNKCSKEKKKKKNYYEINELSSQNKMLNHNENEFRSLSNYDNNINKFMKRHSLGNESCASMEEFISSRYNITKLKSGINKSRNSYSKMCNSSAIHKKRKEDIANKVLRNDYKYIINNIDIINNENKTNDNGMNKSKEEQESTITSNKSVSKLEHSGSYIKSDSKILKINQNWKNGILNFLWKDSKEINKDKICATSTELDDEIIKENDNNLSKKSYDNNLKEKKKKKKTYECVPVIIDWGLIKQLDNVMKLAFCKLVYNINCMNFINIIEAFEDMGFCFNDDFTYDPEIYIENLKKFFLKKFEESEIKLNENENTSNNNGKENNMSFLKNMDKNEVIEKSPISDVPKDIIFFLRVASLLHGLCTQLNVKINYLSIFSKRAKEALENTYKPIDTSIYITPISKRPKTFLEKRIHNFIKKLYQKKKILGCQICIIHKKKIVVDTCVGMIGVIDRRPITRHSLFNGYSLNKLILNIALIHLIYNKNNDEDTFENEHLNLCGVNKNSNFSKQFEKDIVKQNENKNKNLKDFQDQTTHFDFSNLKNEIDEIDKIDDRCNNSKNISVIENSDEKKENQNNNKIEYSINNLQSKDYKKKKLTQINSEKETYKNIELEKIKKFKQKLNSPISNYWDGFICNNKKYITIKDFLTLKCYIRKPFHENITLNKFINYDSMVNMIENAKNYNVKNKSKTYGEYMYLIDTYIISELIYNISGLKYYEYIYKNIIKPLNLEEEMFIPLPSYFLNNFNDKNKKTNKTPQNNSTNNNKVVSGFISSNNFGNISSDLVNIKDNEFEAHDAQNVSFYNYKGSYIESYYNSKGSENKCNNNISNFRKKKYEYKDKRPFFIYKDNRNNLENQELSNNVWFKNKRINGIYKLSNNLFENKFINISNYNYKINKNNILTNINNKKNNEVIKNLNRSASVDVYFSTKKTIDIKKKVKSESIEKTKVLSLNINQHSSDFSENTNIKPERFDKSQSFKDSLKKENNKKENFYDAKDNLTKDELNDVHEKYQSIETNKDKNNGCNDKIETNIKQKDVFSLKHTFFNHVDNLKEKTRKINDSIKNIYENNDSIFLKNLFTSQKKGEKYNNRNFDNNNNINFDNIKDLEKDFDLRNIEYKHLYEKKNLKKIRKRDIFFESMLKHGKLNNVEQILNINKLKTPLKNIEKTKIINNSNIRSLSYNNIDHENNLFKNSEPIGDVNKNKNSGKCVNTNYENKQFFNNINEKGKLYYKNQENESNYNKKELIPSIFVSNIILEPNVDKNENRESITIKNYKEYKNNNLNFNENVKTLYESVVSENSSDESVNSILKENYNNYQKKKNIKYKKLYKYITELKEYIRNKEKQLEMIKKNEFEYNNSFIFENDHIFKINQDIYNKNEGNNFQTNNNNYDIKQKEAEYEIMKKELFKEKNLLKKLVNYKYSIIKKQIENITKKKTKKIIYNNEHSDEYAMFSDTDYNSNYEYRNYFFNTDYLKIKDRNINEKIKKLETYLIMKKTYKKNNSGHIPEIHHTINKHTDVYWKLVYSKRNETIAEKLSENGNLKNNFDNILNSNLQKGKKKINPDNGSENIANDIQKNKEINNMKKENDNNDINLNNANEQEEKIEPKFKSYLNNFNSKQCNKYISFFQLVQNKPYVLDPLIYDSKKILNKFIPINGRFTAKALTKVLAFTNENLFFPSKIMNKIRKVYTIEESIESFILTGGMSRKWGLGFQLFECEYDGEINEEFSIQNKKNKTKNKQQNKKTNKIIGYGQSDCSGCFTLSFPEINLSITLLLSDLYKGAETAHLILEYIMKLYGIRPKWKVPIKVSNLLKVL
ncbi:atypical protein kinase, ABC-1 family, putative [Plasmodium berghei]|uniref:Atypical protein kinase, ABC-1 family, putative n=2 Tax=Plasmodium berghei TaxID=5821 RepID=A0A509AN45_PLABA|nr:atypical protein kinase, ABC-1 family, putative [Plasmodium berghei ANKA]CXI54705.1 atypical protein kinase, ABC-1 family, putative [Plasmodium berghei]SCL95023.1 atypical protein kinase, ABC-1 family, putative [Plasmodium berghei]SCM16157.1 atypical protein kinase, ABC-1 family, putative [Plasmodium berghei]SCN26325.1 atypical protein kinase, ABC-1 family, putative [Plasmodium berghei]VUC56279.1 atypical protein kinase, ABC-1 family, putative [Plasmodium berghei ANKA]|eukprot:XP_034422081.1 atypical protein kinase, ABC-1 family, putative [Plasmodium berghei ANKA]